MAKTGLRILTMLAPVMLLAAGASAAASQTRTASRLATTPSGWVPVAYANAELFIPSNWYVLYDSPPCPTRKAPGEMFVNPKAGVFHCPELPVSGPRTVVSLGAKQSSSTSYGHPLNINGFLVYPFPADSQNSYVVPSLGVEITVSGPLGPRVLHTLNGSPRAEVLTPGAAPSVPSSWQVVSFAGLMFSVPTNWPVVHNQVVNVPGNPCRVLGVAFGQTEVSLSTDARPFIRNFMCALLAPTPYVATDTVQVDSGLQASPFVTFSFSNHCLKLHGLTVCTSATPGYSILFFRVTIPGRAKALLVSLGLAGDGTVARTILYSLREAVA
jgi:hypothetical protein